MPAYEYVCKDYSHGIKFSSLLKNLKLNQKSSVLTVKATMSRKS
jgi:hypothetical protein